MSCTCAHSIKLSAKYSVCVGLLPSSGASEKTFRLVTNEVSDETQQKQRERYMQLALLAIGFTLSLLWGSISFPVGLWTTLYGDDVWRLCCRVLCERACMRVFR